MLNVGDFGLYKENLVDEHNDNLFIFRGEKQYIEFDDSVGGLNFEFSLLLFFYGIGLGPYAGFVGDDGK